MPANERSLRITDAYRQRLIAIRDRIRRQVVLTWGQVTVDDLDRSHAQWLEQAAAMVDQGQRAGVRLTSAYLAAYIASELGRPPSLPIVDEARFLGAEDGRSVEAPLSATLIGVKALLKDGRRPGDALNVGQARAGRLASTALLHSPRMVLAEIAGADERISGWRRVPKPGACLACLAAADGIHAKGERLRIHDECSCTAEPVVGAVFEPTVRPSGVEMFSAMTPAQQDARYGEKAALIRTGQARLEDFIDRSPMALVPDRITEAPLQAVT